MSNTRRRLGVLGGMGPMATVYFYELLTHHTKADTDQDHLDAIITSRATTPDRTAYLVGESLENPLPAMVEELRRLVACGAEIIAMPCNTSHVFFDELAAAAGVPFLNMVALSVDKALAMGCEKLGIMATEGTVRAGVYQRACQARGLACLVLGPQAQAAVTNVIYRDVKAGREPNAADFRFAADELLAGGCQRLLLGCTELSLVKKVADLNDTYIDTMEVLAEASILACGASTTGFTWNMSE